MWIKNLNTGHVWKITSEKQIKTMLSDAKYEEVSNPNEINNDNKDAKTNDDKNTKTNDDTKTTSKRNNPNQTKTMECEICGRKCKGQRSYTQHKRMAHGEGKDGDE